MKDAKDAKDATDDQVRGHRVLLHRRAIVERVLPLGAPPLRGDVAIQRDATSATSATHGRADASLLDRLGQGGRGPGVTDVMREDHSLFGDRQPRRRDGERASWMRYLMNVHLMWVD
jgi:hypothetical protein